MAVVWVALSAPNSGTVVEAAQSRDGSIDTKCTARVSPGSAPSTWNGPVWGFTKGKSITRETTSSGPRTLPPKASSVQTSSTVRLIGYGSALTNLNTDLPIPSAVKKAGTNARIPSTGTTPCSSRLNSERRCRA